MRYHVRTCAFLHLIHLMLRSQSFDTKKHATVNRPVPTVENSLKEFVTPTSPKIHTGFGA